MRPLVIALGIVMLAGCAITPVMQDDPSRAGNVGVTDITRFVPANARIVLAENETFLVAIDDAANAPPVYPEALLARQLPPRTVCLSVGIAEDGQVISSTPVDQSPDCPGPDAVEAAFFAAAAQAVQGWRYDPALRCVFPDAMTKADANASCSGGREVAQAVSLAYRFVFEQRDGRGSVRMSQ
ncbi:hypothetical protein ACFOLC_08610 [Lysobacter cavernae]|uniref:Lipoprotein n=1 Tax=Lysobacter cavernae TaxID=1685901 RepID=A0ABV7RP06_9GAMM